jgi:D-alanyl-D-alanine carboxypeptidase/D-alanyl-D-alanine-endopeptidase (penicillin-binding protein 4)
MIILKRSKLLIILILVLFMACSAPKKMLKDIESNAQDNDFFQGISVIDAESGKNILDFQGHKYFTPASNVKIFTLFAGLNYLGDSVPSFAYHFSNDSLVIRGTADPMFFNDSLHQRSESFLKETRSNIFLIDEMIEGPVYGPGWSWEDYEMSYMPEKSLFPLYGNLVRVSQTDDKTEVKPPFFGNRLQVRDHSNFSRDPNDNDFYVNGSVDSDKSVPFKTSNQLTADLLSELLETKVTLIDSVLDESLFTTFYDIPYDSLYVRMMKESDNFIAEQLLLQVSKKVTGTYNSKKGIAYLLDSVWVDLPQKPRWVDGSGLSRYNLFSPQTMTYLLRKMYRKIPHDRLQNYFPKAGEEGTLKNSYTGMSYVRAKSGFLSNNYCLSGYLTTRKGKVLIFSIMNNHFQGSSARRKSGIADLLKSLYDNL